MKALSVRQPWAWLIVNGWKDIENRGWATAYRGRICIHAGANRNWAVWLEEIARLSMDASRALISAESRNEIIYGALLGEVDIVGCRPATSHSPWAEPGQYHWELANDVAYPQPIPYKGKLGLFEVTLP